MLFSIKSKNIFFVATLAVLLNKTAFAGFLDMPEIAETPELQRKSMLRDIDIPPVRDRNPDPQAGPRLAVSEFRIQGLVEYPKLGITREAVQKLVEGIRYKLMQEDKLLESGYSIDELGELSDLLVDIEEQTEGRHVTPLEVQKLVWLIREQRMKRGITLGQIEAIADEITKFYRERGFILAKAYIPKQHVREGIVTLTLLLGTLGEVEANGNEIYKSKRLTSVFNNMLGKPVTNDAVEENLYIINDFPGINVDGFFEPGSQVGDTKLNINVRHENRYGASVRLDNHGTDQTGLYRLYGEGRFNNLLGFADVLTLSALAASSPSNTLYGRVNYLTNFFHPRLKLILDASQNQFSVDQQNILVNNLALNGVVTVYDAALRYYLKRSRKKNYTLEFKYEEIESDMQLGDLPDIGNNLDDKLANRKLIFSYDILQESSTLLHQGYVELTSGDYIYGANLGQDENYYYLTTGYTLLKFLHIPWVEADTRLVFRTDLAYAGMNLSSIVRFSLGGPTRARAFQTNLFSADDAIYLGLDWVFNSPILRNNLRPFIFVDYAYGKQYSLLATEGNPTASLADAGFGLQFNYERNFSGNLQFAFPITADFSFENADFSGEGMRVVFDMQYQFF